MSGGTNGVDIVLDEFVFYFSCCFESLPTGGARVSNDGVVLVCTYVRERFRLTGERIPFSLKIWYIGLRRKNRSTVRKPMCFFPV